MKGVPRSSLILALVLLSPACGGSGSGGGNAAAPPPIALLADGFDGAFPGSNWTVTGGSATPGSTGTGMDGVLQLTGSYPSLANLRIYFGVDCGGWAPNKLRQQLPHHFPLTHAKKTSGVCVGDFDFIKYSEMT